MELSAIFSAPTTAARSGSAPSVLGTAGDGAAVFAASLTQALDALATSVAAARSQVQANQDTPQGAAVLSDAANSLAALAQQLRQALASAAPTASTQGAASAGGSAATTSAVAATPVTMGKGNVQTSDTVSGTELWVRAALNRSVALARANGYDPEKSHAVNTLRGYFSGDAQARSQALHSLDLAMLQAGGAYETFDGGVHAIGGKPPVGMDTSMPVFQTAWDKDWSRPTLYDQINSSLGWESSGEGVGLQPINYADPANRDAVLNRKLSDAEVAAFQSGQLTPELQAQVHRYRSARA